MEAFMKGGDDFVRQSDSRGFSEISPELPFKDSREFDFGDVFGGPPRHLLMRGTSSEAEKQIVGGKSVMRRRHVHGDDFFDDIFRGDESYTSTWTHLHRSSEIDQITGVSGIRYTNETNGGQDEIKYEVHQSKRFHSIADLKGDFANILNTETNSSIKTHVKTQSQSCRWTSDQKISQVIENSRNVEPERRLPTKNRSYASKHEYTNKKTAFSPEFMRSDSKILVENSDDSFEDLFELQELSDDLEKDAPSTEASEETKASDAKIRLWSAGKKGNLRSLLSTLQYVLWEGSEWEAIALVDLVEENQVKRAYQKALLRLHPDKLQQRNAAKNHKYIAQKLFEILQEAWDHFNNIAPL